MEYLRFALGRSTVDAAESSATNRERHLIASTLIGGFVEVDLDRNGVIETWRRTLENQSHITVSSDSEERNLPVTVAQERFRARAFSQKQLSTIVRRPENADEQITGIAAAESVDRRRQAEQEIEEAERAVRVAFQRLVESWVAEASLNRAEAASTDLTRRLESIRIRLEQGGLSAAQQEILNKQPRYNHAVAALQTAMKLVQATTEHVSQLKLLSLDGWDQAIDTPSVTGARQTIVRLNERLQKASNEIKDALAQAHDELALRRSEFDVERASFTAEYEQASQAQSHLAALLAE